MEEAASFTSPLQAVMVLLASFMSKEREIICVYITSSSRSFFPQKFSGIIKLVTFWSWYPLDLIKLNNFCSLRLAWILLQAWNSCTTFKGGWEHSRRRLPAPGRCNHCCLLNADILYVIRGLASWCQHSFTAENDKSSGRRVIPAPSKIAFSLLCPLSAELHNPTLSHAVFLNTNREA